MWLNLKVMHGGEWNALKFGGAASSHSNKTGQLLNAVQLWSQHKSNSGSASEQTQCVWGHTCCLFNRYPRMWRRARLMKTAQETAMFLVRRYMLAACGDDELCRGNSWSWLINMTLQMLLSDKLHMRVSTHEPKTGERTGEAKNARHQYTTIWLRRPSTEASSLLTNLIVLRNLQWIK